MPPPEKPPLREELELLARPKPPDELGLLVDVLIGELLGVLANERCDWVGLEMARALAAVASAFGEVAGLEITGVDELRTVDPAVRVLMEPA